MRIVKAADLRPGMSKLEGLMDENNRELACMVTAKVH